VKLVQKFELADILLIDKKGNVVYTMAKKVDFAQNFKTSPLRNTNLGELYRQLMLSHNEDPVIFKDYESYPADLGAPACFMGVPIYEPRLNRAERGEKVGTLIFQVSNEKITNLLTNNLNWAGESLGTTGEIAMVGPDYLLRNNTRRFLEDPTFYYNNLLRSTGDTAVVEKIRRQKTTILLRKYQNQSSVQAINGKNGHFQTTDFLGSEVLDVYMPMNILGTRWAMICEMDGAEMFQSTIVFRNQLLIVGVIVFVFITILGAYLAKSLADPMRKIQKEVTMLSEGIFPKITTHIYNDELGKIDEAMNKLISNMREVATFAENIGRENFDFPFTPKNNQDILGNALLSMRDSLKTLSIAEHQRGWVSTGKALFAELLRKHNDSLDAMGNVIIAELIKYIGANQGAFFLQDDQTKQLRILSAYAYDRRKYLHKALQPGEGLVGQVFLERSRIYLTEIPEDYVDITSGLGHARPRCILVIPVQANRQIYGVIELASFDYLEDYKLEFVESVGEDIALTITNLKTTEETKRLLQESQKITQQLRQQEEEMRQNFEELLATQDEMRERYGKLDELLHGKITLEEMQENGDWVGDFQLDEYGMDKKVKDAILRQKTLLDEAYTKNQLREQIIRNKVENTNGNQQ
jgi:methyl-accepting chemotaxis protein